MKNSLFSLIVLAGLTFACQSSSTETATEAVSEAVESTAVIETPVTLPDVSTTEGYVQSIEDNDDMAEQTRPITVGKGQGNVLGYSLDGKVVKLVAKYESAQDQAEDVFYLKNDIPVYSTHYYWLKGSNGQASKSENFYDGNDMILSNNKVQFTDNGEFPDQLDGMPFKPSVENLSANNSTMRSNLKFYLKELR
jgi:hypothetical protein